MQHEFALTPKELYFLASILKARYFDYSYYRVLGDVQKRAQFHRREALRHLTELGLYREDFSGTVTVSKALTETLEPVFFGPTETTVQLLFPAGGKMNTWRLHMLGQKITRVIIEKDWLALRILEDSDLERLIKELTPQSTATAPLRPLDKPYVQRIVTVRQATVGSPVHEEIWLEQDGLLYKDSHAPELTYLTAKDFSKHIYDILKGEHVWEA